MKLLCVFKLLFRGGGREVYPINLDEDTISQCSVNRSDPLSMHPLITIIVYQHIMI